MRKPSAFLAPLLFAAIATISPTILAQTAAPNWQAKLQHQLPLLGHRNWILIVDSAYPLQVSPGIEVVDTSADQLAVTRAVLSALDRSVHVKPIVYLDAELPWVPSQKFPRLDAYRADLKKALQGLPTQSLPHEQIIARVGDTGKEFKVLVLKTTMTMPYTSVFLQLDCKYWGADDEQKLRQAMKSSSK